MASAYKRDDKQFREQVRKLAEAGLNLDRHNLLGEPGSLGIKSALYGASYLPPGCSKSVTVDMGQVERNVLRNLSVPERSRAAELVCGLLAYGVLIACAVVLVKWVILPLWGAL